MICRILVLTLALSSVALSAQQAPPPQQQLYSPVEMEGLKAAYDRAVETSKAAKDAQDKWEAVKQDVETRHPGFMIDPNSGRLIPVPKKPEAQPTTSNKK